MKPKTMILTALFAALSAVGAFIRIPLPYVPFTMQVFFCVLAGLVLGAGLGALSQGLYVAIGLLGIPVFTQGGGLSYVLQPTFGYILGFVLCAGIAGLMARRAGHSYRRLALAALVGAGAVYAVGLPYLYGVQNLLLQHARGPWWVLRYGLLPFMPGDILSALLAALVAQRLRRSGISPLA